MVHCRTGSLEIKDIKDALDFLVHCRTGSLEKDVISISFKM